MHIAFAGGKQNFRVKRYNEYHQSCKNCKAFELEIEVFMDCFHLYYIPFFSLGNKTIKIYCKNCNEVIQNESLENDYKRKTDTPLYFFTGTVFFTLLFSAAFIYIQYSDKRDLEMIENPETGDAYVIKRKINDSVYNYSLIKVITINKDTLTVYPNSIEYQTYPYPLKPEDHYVKENKRLLLKSELKDMFKNDKISSIYRR